MSVLAHPTTHTCTFPGCGTVMPWEQERCPSCGRRTFTRIREIARRTQELAEQTARPSSQTAVLVPVEAPE